MAVVGYHVYRNNTQIATTATATYSDTTVIPGTQYSYTVSAFDAAGNTSGSVFYGGDPNIRHADLIFLPSLQPSVHVTSTSLRLTGPHRTDKPRLRLSYFRGGTQVATTSGPSYTDTG